MLKPSHTRAFLFLTLTFAASLSVPALDPHLELSEYSVERYTKEKGLPVDPCARCSRTAR